MKKFNKIKNISRLSDEVHRQILEAVSNRSISPHDRIIQEDLADMMDVSRTPVRDALLRLESEGVLVRVGRRGFHLRSFTFEEVEQLYRAREAVECYAFGRLSQQLNADEISRLRVTIEELERGSQESVMDYFNTNRAIHREFVVQAKNPVLVEMFDSIWNRGGCPFLFSELGSAELKRSLTGHLDLCDLLNHKDEQLAMQKMRQHIRDGLELHRHSIADDEFVTPEVKSNSTDA